MAGIWLTLCLPASAGGEVEAAIAAAMAPFFMDGDNPVDRGMWDHWTIRGGDDGTGFAVADGHWDDPRLVHGSRRSAPGVCAGGPRGLLDLDRPQLAHDRARGATWDAWQQLSATLPAARPLAEFVRQWHDDPEARRADRYGDAALAAYRQQPLIRAFLEHPHGGGSLFQSVRHPHEHPVIGFRGSREEYVRPARPRRFGGGSVLTPDGWWYEPRGQVVHGVCDPYDCPHPEPELGEDTDRYLAGLPDDTLLVRLHCHG